MGYWNIEITFSIPEEKNIQNDFEFFYALNRKIIKMIMKRRDKWKEYILDWKSKENELLTTINRMSKNTDDFCIFPKKKTKFC